MTNYLTVPSLSVLNNLKNHEPNEICYCEETSKLYQYSLEESKWVEMKTDGQGLNLNLYELNKNVISQLPFLDRKENEKTFRKKLNEFKENNKNSNYFMLLNNELHYFTILTLNQIKNKIGELSTFENTIIDLIYEIGQIYSLEFTEDNSAIEIWIKPNGYDEPHVFYLFNYSEGVVYYK